MSDQMTKDEAIEAGWKPIEHYQPRDFLGGPYTMWESPCGKFQLFCPPTHEYQRKYLRGIALDELVEQAQELDMGYGDPVQDRREQE